jgi:hypothetical protein
LKIGRNEPCPCGSGKKYKKCCLVKTDMQRLAEAVTNATHNIKNEARIKQCLHPKHDECDNKIIRAHAIQNNRILSKIAENGMLVTLDGTQFHMFQVSDLKGRKNATTFTGFCSYHDKTLFQDIEDSDFVASTKQVFLFTYRTMAWHYHKKQEQTNAALIQCEKMFDQGYDMTKSEDFSDYMTGLKLGLEDNDKEKKIFDQALLSEDYESISYTIWEIPYAVNFSISMMHELEYDIEGNRINDLLNNENVYSIYLNIFPANNKSFCIWSWLKNNDSVFSKFVKQFEALEILDKENYLNNNLLRWSDSIVISPRLWNKWGEGIQQGILAHANFEPLYRVLENEENMHAYEYMDTPWNLFENISD